jgi:hypothetical protein
MSGLSEKQRKRFNIPNELELMGLSPEKAAALKSNPKWAEFLGIMKGRGHTKFWANDDVTNARCLLSSHLLLGS